MSLNPKEIEQVCHDSLSHITQIFCRQNSAIIFTYYLKSTKIITWNSINYEF